MLLNIKRGIPSYNPRFHGDFSVSTIAEAFYLTLVNAAQAKLHLS
jgi:hypothetical protein